MSRLKRLLAAAGEVIDDLSVRPKARTQAQRKLPSQNPLAVQIQRAAKPRPALPAPKKPLALPPPDPAKQLPSFAAKPKGGQWWTEQSPLPMFAPRQALQDAVYMSERFSSDPVDKSLLDWWDKAVPRYIQNEMATPADPLRDLAARGLLHTEMAPDEWSQTAGAALAPISLQKLLFEDETRKRLGDEALETMPWLAKIPATDSVYGVNPQKMGALNLAHVRDEMRNALRPETSGIPADLALRPESLARMSFPQAVERVGRINQFRAKQMAEQQLAALNNPAVQTFKEYPDAGYRWVELRAPELSEDLLTAEDRTLLELSTSSEALQERLRQLQSERLQDALRFEGDTMGHCVGGYCDDVLSGNSRIFSLRDAKGQPHVTIETAPARKVFSDIRTAAGQEQADRWFDEGVSLEEMARLANLPNTQDIIQIKGKQNRAPVDEYLPYVQDFVKSGTWGNIGDLSNTGLVKLPDGRYLAQQQYDEALDRAVAGGVRNPSVRTLTDWDSIAPYFEGYAVGGRVAANRCFSRNPLAVRATE